MKFNVTFTVKGQGCIITVPAKGNPIEAECLDTLLVYLAGRLPDNGQVDLRTIGINIQEAE